MPSSPIRSSTAVAVSSFSVDAGITGRSPLWLRIVRPVACTVRQVVDVVWARIGCSAACNATSAWWAASRPGTRRAESTGVIAERVAEASVDELDRVLEAVVSASAAGDRERAADQGEQQRDGDRGGGGTTRHSDERMGRGTPAGGSPTPVGRPIRRPQRPRRCRQRACSHMRARALTARLDDG